MEIQSRQINDIAILTIRGSIDELNAPQIAEQVDGLITKGIKKMVMDFSGVDYTSSAGLRVLLGGVKRARAHGGDLRLAAVQPDVKRVLDICGFLDLLKWFDSVDLALSDF